MSGTALAVIENLEKASDLELEEMASALFASDFSLVSSDKAPFIWAALSLYWAGLTVGRLISSAIADRFDHVRFTLASTLLMAGLLAVAILAPTLPLSIAAFALAGVASGLDP